MAPFPWKGAVVGVETNKCTDKNIEMICNCSVPSDGHTDGQTNSQNDFSTDTQTDRQTE